MTAYRAALQAVLDTEVRPRAADVDRTGDYPRAAITALGSAGLLGLTSAREMGGGGSAFRKELGIERHFRDALAARVMAPTTEALHDFTGRAALGLPLFDTPEASA
ncbi:acyl-CoA dehydrogenase family protein [Actinoplanes flavus]|uniref:Acyl-CoA dehydrogenase family protein n=1 Tax=Actinoplanes flavus TaxID=2820290 RepID=A0ABS3USE3_9ACTN|nr:acyl-CoA dehydrogenase family protein [Actinoplanes flavus]MBO3741479.1 acyl-CoA dehydrogenase family protein [Actinoplanes flavus]